jgi:hypothetical protein
VTKAAIKAIFSQYHDDCPRMCIMLRIRAECQGPA